MTDSLPSVVISHRSVGPDAILRGPVRRAAPVRTFSAARAEQQR